MITPLTMYNIDNTIFDGITLPIYTFPRAAEYPDLFLSGWNMDKTVFIDNLLIETAELDTLYTDPAYFKYAVTQWAKKEFPVWQSLYETLFYKYNPIWNKDGTIKANANEIRAQFGSNVSNKLGSNNTSNTENEHISDVDNTNRIYNESETANKTSNETNNEFSNEVETNSKNKSGTSDTTTTESVSAFDASTYAPRSQTVIDNDTTENEVNSGNTVNTKSNATNGSEDNTNNTNGYNADIRNYERGRSNTNNVSGSNNESAESYNSDTGNTTNNTNTVEQGNIGVTSSQQLIQAERDLVKFNIYDFIIDSFKARFCLLIY